MDPPCAVQELDQQKIMPEIQDELGLQTRNPQKITRESYWFRVYDMIFGKQTREAREIHPCMTFQSPPACCMLIVIV